MTSNGLRVISGALLITSKGANSRAYVTKKTSSNVMNQLDPIEELYEMYSEEEDTLRIVELEDDGLDFVSDIEGPADPYMDL